MGTSPNSGDMPHAPPLETPPLGAAFVVDRRRHVCWWSVSDEDELPGGGTQRTSTDVAPSCGDDMTTASDTSTQTETFRRDRLAASATDTDYSQLNHVVRQSDVLKSVSIELRFYVPLDTEKITSETFFPANLLAWF